MKGVNFFIYFNRNDTKYNDDQQKVISNSSNSTFLWWRKFAPLKYFHNKIVPLILIWYHLFLDCIFIVCFNKSICWPSAEANSAHSSIYQKQLGWDIFLITRLYCPNKNELLSKVFLFHILCLIPMVIKEPSSDLFLGFHWYIK